jgi:hypothetical protein
VKIGWLEVLDRVDPLNSGVIDQNVDAVQRGPKGIVGKGIGIHEVDGPN